MFKYKCVVRRRKSSKCQKEDVFTESLDAEYPFLKEDQQVGKVVLELQITVFNTAWRSF
jgi:hypothetical protein